MIEYFLSFLVYIDSVKIQEWLSKETGFLIAITGFIAVLLLLRKQLKKLVVIINQRRLRIKKWFNTPHIVLDRLDKQDEVLKQIKSQVFPNGGGSISDKLDQALQLARKADQRSIVLTERAQIAVYECDSNGSCTFVNSILARIFGMERSEMLGNGWLKAIDSEDKTRVYNTFIEAIRNKIPYNSHYTVVNQKTGEKVKCFASAEVTRGLNGEIIFIHGTVEVENNRLDIR